MSEEITINGFTFLAPTPYTEGHPCTAAEAMILNRRLHANLRSNFSRIMDNLSLEGITVEDVRRVLYFKFAVYCAEYSLNGTDPVEEEATAIARAAVKAKIKSNGGAIGTYTTTQINTLIEDILSGPQRQEIYEQARARLKLIREAARRELAKLSS